MQPVSPLQPPARRSLVRAALTGAQRPDSWETPGCGPRAGAGDGGDLGLESGLVLTVDTPINQR